MRLLQSVVGLLAGVASFASATTLTYKLAPNEKACFYTWVSDANQKVAFYFAVCKPRWRRRIAGSFNAEKFMLTCNC